MTPRARLVAGLLSLGLAACGSTAPASSPAPAPEGWQYLSWSDPAFAVALPADWVPDTLGTIDDDVVAAASPEQQKAYRASNELVRSGAIRLWAQGAVHTADGSGPDATILVIVQGGGDSLAAFGARMSHWWQDNFGGSNVTLTDAVLPYGPAIRADWESERYQGIYRDYLVHLADGRNMEIEIGAGMDPATDGRVRGFADTVVLTLKPGT